MPFLSRTSHLAFGALVLGVLACGAAAEAATRVALVSGDRGNAVASLLDLAVARLTADGELELLERDQIRRVLDEQKLTQSGRIDATQAIAVGKLLAADLIGVVEQAAGNGGVLSIVVFDAQTGVRYRDEGLPEITRPDAATQALVAAVQSASRKRSRFKQGLHTVGLVTVRNADLPRNKDGLCEAVGFLVERHLPRSPDIAVLERRRLERINQERALVASGDTNELLASISTVDLEISRGAEGQGLQAVALINESKLDQPRRVVASVRDLNAPALAEALTQKLIEHWQAAAAVGVPDRSVEARRYDGEAQHHFSHRQIADSVRAAEAAWALDPDNETFGERLSQHLIRNAVVLFSPTESTVTKGGSKAWTDANVDPAVLDSLLNQAYRSLEINRQLTRPTANRIRYNMDVGMLCDRLRGFRRVTSAPTARQLDGFLRACQRRNLDYCDSLASRAAADPKWLDGYSTTLGSEIGFIKSASIDTADYAQALFQVASRWNDVTRDWQPRFNTTDGAEAFTSLLRTFVVPGIFPWEVDQREYARTMAPLFVAMQRHARPIVRLYGHFGQIRGEILLGSISEEAGYTRFATVYRPLATSIITAPEPWHADRTRSAAYEAWRTAIDGIPGKSRHEFARRELLELCQFMIGRHELVYKVLQQSFSELDRPASLALVHQALPVVDSPQFNESDREKNRLRSLLKSTEQNILLAQPDLAKGTTALPWTGATRVFDLTAFRELSELVGCLLVDKALYGFCVQFDKDRGGLRMIRIPLAGGPPELLDWIDLGVPPKDLAPHLRPRLVTAITSNEAEICLAARGAGIVRFPLKGAAPRRIDTDDGLPSSNVRSLAILDKTLFAGSDEGYLFTYHLQTGQTHVLASSRRKQKQSPFDDGPVFKVPALIADPAQQRVLFVIGRHLWQYQPSDGGFKQVVDLVAASKGRSQPKLDGSTITFSSRRGDRMLVSNVFHILEIDLARDSAVEIHAPEFGVFPTHPPHLVVRGDLWSGGNFGRLSLDRRELQSLPALDGNARPFRPTVLLELAPDGRHIVAADPVSVWLLKLQDRDDVPPASGDRSRPGDR